MRKILFGFCLLFCFSCESSPATKSILITLSETERLSLNEKGIHWGTVFTFIDELKKQLDNPFFDSSSLKIKLYDNFSDLTYQEVYNYFNDAVKIENVNPDLYDVREYNSFYQSLLEDNIDSVTYDFNKYKNEIDPKQPNNFIDVQLNGDKINCIPDYFHKKYGGKLFSSSYDYINIPLKIRPKSENVNYVIVELKYDNSIIEPDNSCKYQNGYKDSFKINLKSKLPSNIIVKGDGFESIRLCKRDDSYVTWENTIDKDILQIKVEEVGLTEETFNIDELLRKIPYVYRNDIITGGLTAETIRSIGYQDYLKKVFPNNSMFTIYETILPDSTIGVFDLVPSEQTYQILKFLIELNKNHEKVVDLFATIITETDSNLEDTIGYSQIN